MKLQSKIATSVGLTLLLACAVFAQQVKTDYDHNTNFSQYKTYSWKQVQTRDPLLVDRIKSAVNSALAAKGLTEVPSGGDVEVAAVEMTKNQETIYEYTCHEGSYGMFGILQGARAQEKTAEEAAKKGSR